MDYRTNKRRLGWRWWSWWRQSYYYSRAPLHTRPHIGRRRCRRVLDQGPEWARWELRSAAGRRLGPQKPPYILHIETVVSGPYEEYYAGYRATWWYQRRVIRDRERRGWDRGECYRGLYRGHAIQK